MRNCEIIPQELADIDERCKIWARVTKDRPRTTETPLYRAMLQYGGHVPEKNPEDPEPLPPLTQAQIRDGWLIDRAWRSRGFVLQNRMILLCWYFGKFNDPYYIARFLKIPMREVGRRMRAALCSIRNIAERMRNDSEPLDKIEEN